VSKSERRLVSRSRVDRVDLPCACDATPPASSYPYPFLSKMRGVPCAGAGAGAGAGVGVGSSGSLAAYGRRDDEPGSREKRPDDT